MFQNPIEPTGIVAAYGPREGDAFDRIVRPSILVHSGPNGSPATLLSSDGPLVFDVNRIKTIVDVNNERIASLESEYGGVENTPIGAYPPILDLHADLSMDNVCGRLVGRLWYELRDVPKVGKAVACVMGNVHFLGQEAVNAVHLGRYFHLSVGIDDDESSSTYNVLGETSVVIEPAAPGAMILKKGKAPVKRKDPAMGKKLSATAKKKKLSARTALIADIKSATKKLTAGLEGVKTRVVATTEKSRLSQRQGSIRNRLSRLMADKKLAPAEFKKMDLSRLAALDDASLETVLETLGVRENIIEPGQRGSTGAVPFAEMGQQLEKAQKTTLRHSIRESMIAKGAKLSKAATEDMKKHLSGAPVEDAKLAKNPGRKRLSSDTASVDKPVKELEADDVLESGEEEAIEEEVVEETAGLQEQIDELSTQVARIVSLVDQVVDNDEDEIADESEDAELEADKEGEEKKDLSKDDSKDDDKEKKLSEDKESKQDKEEKKD